MKFDEAKREFLRLYLAQDAAGQALERRWVLRQPVVGDDHRPYDPGLEVRVSRTSWGDSGLRVGVYVSSVLGDHLTEPFRDLPAADLRRVLACRELVDRWVAGDVDELPIEPPLEITGPSAIELQLSRANRRAAFYKSCALSGEVPSAETIAEMDR